MRTRLRGVESMTRNSSMTCVLVLLNLTLLLSPGEAVKCSVCDSSGKHGDSCLTHPPPARDCDGMDHCINVARYSSQRCVHTFCGNKVILKKRVGRVTFEVASLVYEFMCSLEQVEGVVELEVQLSSASAHKMGTTVFWVPHPATKRTRLSRLKCVVCFCRQVKSITATSE